jgi:cytoskeletal protein RodZ
MKHELSILMTSSYTDISLRECMIDHETKRCTAAKKPLIQISNKRLSILAKRLPLFSLRKTILQPIQLAGQSTQSVNPASQPSQSAQPVNPASQPSQSTQPVNPTSQPSQSTQPVNPAVNPASQTQPVKPSQSNSVLEWWFWNNQKEERHFFEDVNSIY